MEYNKCLVEVDEILRFMPDEELKKIPIEIRKSIKENKDRQYKWNYNKKKELKEQDINRKTVAILSYLNMQYLLNNNQKILMEKIHNLNEKKSEEQKRKKYNIENTFNNNYIKPEEEKLELIEVKEEKWYNKLFSFIKRIFIK